MRKTTLLHEMKRRNAKYGLEPICGCGGLGLCATSRESDIFRLELEMTQ